MAIESSSDAVMDVLNEKDESIQHPYAQQVGYKDTYKDKGGQASYKLFSEKSPAKKPTKVQELENELNDADERSSSTPRFGG